MTYDPHNLRSRLTRAEPASDMAAAAPAFFDFSQLEPDEISGPGSRTWWVRGQNFVLAYSWAVEGDAFARKDQPDEYMVLLLDHSGVVSVATGAEDREVAGPALVVVPPGDSEIEIRRSGPLVRLFSCRAEDLLASCRNAGDYTEAHPHVAPFQAWSGPLGDPEVRAYRIEDYPYEPSRFGRIFRSSTLMVNWFDPDQGPRNPDALSPHSHPDFEQCSLAVDGEYIHHIRTPWTSRAAEWREDEHRLLGSPSIAIIPPPAVHTSQSVGQVRNHLIDIFCPPRADFSAQPGWVINAAEYPDPPGASL